MNLGTFYSKFTRNIVEIHLTAKRKYVNMRSVRTFLKMLGYEPIQKMGYVVTLQAEGMYDTEEGRIAIYPI